MRLSRQKGFTLLEILLVIAAIAILAGIVIFAVNPGRQLAQARNAQRKVDVNTILNAIYQYAIDNRGTILSTIPSRDEATCPNEAGYEICRSDAPANPSCDVILTALTDEQRYLVSLPVDPSGYFGKENGNGYNVFKNSNNRVTVCAPNAELGDSIIVTR